MNPQQIDELQTAANSLSRAEENNSAKPLKIAYREVREIVENICKKSIDVPTILHVEQILNDGNANVLGNSAEAYDRMKELSAKAGFGLKQYEVMHRNTETYVVMNDISRIGIGSSPGEPRVSPESVPYDPVRAAFTRFRKELRKELTNRKVDKYPDNRQVNVARFKATAKAEQRYLEEYLAARQGEEEAKQKHVEDFAKRMEKMIRKIEPPQQESRR